MKVKELYEAIRPERNDRRIPPHLDVYDEFGDIQLASVYKGGMWMDKWKEIPDAIKEAEVLDFSIGYGTIYVHINFVVEAEYKSEERCQMDGYELVHESETTCQHIYYGKVGNDEKVTFAEVVGFE